MQGRWRRWVRDLSVAAGVSTCLVLVVGIRCTGAAYNPQYDARGVGILVESDDPEFRAELPENLDGLICGAG